MLGLGKYEYQLDEKNRVRIPARLKDGLGDEPVITAGKDGCLQLMTKERGRLMLDKLREQTKGTDKGRLIFRKVVESTSDLSLDSQYRFILSKTLLDISKITKNVLFLSNGEFVEIWATEVYENFDKKVNGDVEINISEELGAYDY